MAGKIAKTTAGLFLFDHQTISSQCEQPSSALCMAKLASHDILLDVSVCVKEHFANVGTGLENSGGLPAPPP